MAHPFAVVRSAAVLVLAVLMSEEGDSTGAVLTQLLETYKEKLEMTPAVMDSLSRMIQPANHDTACLPKQSGLVNMKFDRRR
jgi:hypothetical protein